jgi:hypothetical protein
MCCACAVDAHEYMLPRGNATATKVAKVTPHLREKSRKGQEHGGIKGGQDKYLLLGRSTIHIWLEPNCSNPSRGDMTWSNVFMVLVGISDGFVKIAQVDEEVSHLAYPQ